MLSVLTGDQHPGPLSSPKPRSGVWCAPAHPWGTTVKSKIIQNYPVSPCPPPGFIRKSCRVKSDWGARWEKKQLGHKVLHTATKGHKCRLKAHTHTHPSASALLTYFGLCGQNTQYPDHTSVSYQRLWDKVERDSQKSNLDKVTLNSPSQQKSVNHTETKTFR